MLYENVALTLKMPPVQLAQASLRVYLQSQLRLIESQLFILSQKYGVKTISEFDQRIQDGFLHEEDSFEDFFEFDHLEAERETLIKALKEVM